MWWGHVIPALGTPQKETRSSKSSQLHKTLGVETARGRRASLEGAEGDPAKDHSQLTAECVFLSVGCHPQPHPQPLTLPTPSLRPPAGICEFQGGTLLPTLHWAKATTAQRAPLPVSSFRVGLHARCPGSLHRPFLLQTPLPSLPRLGDTVASTVTYFPSTLPLLALKPPNPATGNVTAILLTPIMETAPVTGHRLPKGISLTLLG